MSVHMNDDDARTVFGLLSGLRVFAREMAGSSVPDQAATGARLSLVIDAVWIALGAAEEGLDDEEKGRRELRLVALGDQLEAGGL